MEDATGLTSLDFVIRADETLGDPQAARLLISLERRLRDEPISRILGHNDFYGLDLIVTRDVLDPRADTEMLVDRALAFLRERRLSRPKILDLGTGSGAILCAVLHATPQAFGLGVDLSPAACEVAAKNLDRCGLASRSSIICGCWADAISGCFDLIVANPPYIARPETAALAPEVVRHDPALALFGGEDGLDCYRLLARDFGRLLAKGGAIFLEIGARQAASVVEILSSEGFRDAAVFKDHGGRDRVVTVRNI